MKVVYSPAYHIDIGSHVFPTTKYRRVWQRLAERRVVTEADRLDPVAATWMELALVHTPDYLEKARTGLFTFTELGVLELPWSEEIADGFRLMTGGTLVAARRALADGVCGHLGGGFHHAFRDHGEGFCLFNDVAVAIEVLRREGRIARAAVVDCDVHHGNGTAFIFVGDPAVYTFSIHQQVNYPMVKPPSDLDMGLADDTGDAEYLDRVSGALPQVMASNPDVVVYLAGADPYEDDQLGGLALTKDGLRRRDRLVLDACRQAAAPVVVLLAGGYARRLEDTVEIHAATIEEAMAPIAP